MSVVAAAPALPSVLVGTALPWQSPFAAIATKQFAAEAAPALASGSASDAAASPFAAEVCTRLPRYAHSQIRFTERVSSMHQMLAAEKS